MKYLVFETGLAGKGGHRILAEIRVLMFDLSYIPVVLSILHDIIKSRHAEHASIPVYPFFFEFPVFAGDKIRLKRHQ